MQGLHNYEGGREDGFGGQNMMSRYEATRMQKIVGNIRLFWPDVVAAILNAVWVGLVVIAAAMLAG